MAQLRQPLDPTGRTGGKRPGWCWDLCRGTERTGRPPAAGGARLYRAGTQPAPGQPSEGRSGGAQDARTARPARSEGSAMREIDWEALMQRVEQGTPMYRIGAELGYTNGGSIGRQLKARFGDRYTAAVHYWWSQFIRDRA